MCSRVIVIHKGQIRASDTAENLLKNHRALGAMRLEARVPASDGAQALQSVPGVKDVTAEADGDWSLFQLRLDANADPGEEIWKLAREKSWDVREMTRRRSTLEDVFVELTHSDT
jgi:ABC-2 type transport system ATP-binding protein